MLNEHAVPTARLILHACAGVTQNEPHDYTTITEKFLSRLQTICGTSMRREKHARYDMYVQVILYFLSCFMRQISHVVCLEQSRGRSGNYAGDKGNFLCDKG